MMRGFELAKKIEDEVRKKGTFGSPVVLKDKATGKMFTPVDVEVEHHDDADGSFTIWINMEEM